MTETIARCGIYEDRPQICRDYPTAYHYIPPECTYTFPGGSRGPREGDCSCMVGACCSIPREGGEPGGNPLPSAAGGEPCKYLIWVDQAPEKTAEEGIEKVSGFSHGVLVLKNAFYILED